MAHSQIWYPWLVWVPQGTSLKMKTLATSYWIHCSKIGLSQQVKNDKLDKNCILSLFHMHFKEYRIKNIWLPQGIEPRTTSLTHKRSSTELRQPAGKQTLQFCIYTVKGYCMLCYSLALNRPTKNLFVQRFFLSVECFYSTTLSLHKKKIFLKDKNSWWFCHSIVFINFHHLTNT